VTLPQLQPAKPIVTDPHDGELEAEDGHAAALEHENSDSTTSAPGHLGECSGRAATAR